VCQKIRIALVGGGILSKDQASTGVGMKVGISWVMAPRMELGGSLLFVKDLRLQDGPYLGTAEAILRVATLTGPRDGRVRHDRALAHVGRERHRTAARGRRSGVLISRTYEAEGQNAEKSVDESNCRSFTPITDL
jgi:hypothetical protein